MITKTQFIKEMAKRGNLTGVESEKIFDLFLDTLKYSIKEYGGVKFNCFGRFFVKECKGKVGRNPKTNEPVIVPEYNTVKFNVSDVFKDSFNE